uniref:Uncharacterized protein n=1 Tax=Arundo donax TaxID=35708 RepID=A0A0A8YP08_ARUDO
MNVLQIFISRTHVLNFKQHLKNDQERRISAGNSTF